MKIFDATSAIAFLWEMDFPEGFAFLATRHRLVLPAGVASEIRRPKSRAHLAELVERGCIEIIAATPEAVGRLRDLNPSLGIGECELLALADAELSSARPFLVCDDRAARRRFPGRRYVWTEELLEYMERRGLIGKETLAMLLGRLAKSGFYSRARRPDARSEDL